MWHVLIDACSQPGRCSFGNNILLLKSVGKRVTPIALLSTQRNIFKTLGTDHEATLDELEEFRLLL
jgi:hypothetical protein